MPRSRAAEKALLQHLQPATRLQSDKVRARRALPRRRESTAAAAALEESHERLQAHPVNSGAALDDAATSRSERGEILVRPRIANGMMLGYEEDDTATLEVFRNLWFHTGDLGHRDKDGFIFVHGRVKHMIRRRGENISSWELEKFIS